MKKLILILGLVVFVSLFSILVSADVECYSDADCDDEEDYTEDICVNPWSEDSYCVNEPIICLDSSDCGIDGSTGGTFCQGYYVMSEYISFECHLAGTAQSYCSNFTEGEVVEECVPLDEEGTEGMCYNGVCADLDCTMHGGPENYRECWGLCLETQDICCEGLDSHGDFVPWWAAGTGGCCDDGAAHTAGEGCCEDQGDPEGGYNPDLPPAGEGACSWDQVCFGGAWPGSNVTSGTGCCSLEAYLAGADFCGSGCCHSPSFCGWESPDGLDSECCSDGEYSPQTCDLWRHECCADGADAIRTDAPAGLECCSSGRSAVYRPNRMYDFCCLDGWTGYPEGSTNCNGEVGLGLCCQDGMEGCGTDCCGFGEECAWPGTHNSSCAELCCDEGVGGCIYTPPLSPPNLDMGLAGKQGNVLDSAEDLILDGSLSGDIQELGLCVGYDDCPVDAVCCDDPLCIANPEYCQPVGCDLCTETDCAPYAENADPGNPSCCPVGSPNYCSGNDGTRCCDEGDLCVEGVCVEDGTLSCEEYCVDAGYAKGGFPEEEAPFLPVMCTQELGLGETYRCVNNIRHEDCVPGIEGLGFVAGNLDTIEYFDDMTFCNQNTGGIDNIPQGALEECCCIPDIPNYAACSDFEEAETYSGCQPEGWYAADGDYLILPEKCTLYTQCRDGIDNDNDGNIDMDDPNCHDDPEPLFIIEGPDLSPPLDSQVFFSPDLVDVIVPIANVVVPTAATGCCVAAVAMGSPVVDDEGLPPTAPMVVCSENSDCHEDPDDPRTLNICVDPGTVDSHCGDPIPIVCLDSTECGDSEICVNHGKITSYCDPVDCTQHSHCPEDGLEGVPYCNVDDDSEQKYIDYSCVAGNLCAFTVSYPVTDCTYACTEGECVRCDEAADCFDDNPATPDICLYPDTPDSECTNDPDCCLCGPFT